MGDSDGPRGSILPPHWRAVEALLAAGRDLRQRTNILPPLLTFSPADPEESRSTVPLGTLGSAVGLEDALTVLEQRCGPPEWFAVVADSYGRLAHAVREAHIDPNELADRFILGDAQVVEQLMVLVAAKGGVTAWRQVYRTTSQGEWEWDTIQYMAQPVLPADGILDVMRRHAP